MPPLLLCLADPLHHVGDGDGGSIEVMMRQGQDGPWHLVIMVLMLLCSGQRQLGDNGHTELGDGTKGLGDGISSLDLGDGTALSVGLGNGTASPLPVLGDGTSSGFGTSGLGECTYLGLDVEDQSILGNSSTGWWDDGQTNLGDGELDLGDGQTSFGDGKANIGDGTSGLGDGTPGLGDGQMG